MDGLYSGVISFGVSSDRAVAKGFDECCGHQVSC